jgi:hypothetical protein
MHLPRMLTFLGQVGSLFFSVAKLHAYLSKVGLEKVPWTHQWTWVLSAISSGLVVPTEAWFP